MASSTGGPKPALAILDDYFHVSPPIFEHLSSSLSDIKVYDTTISAKTNREALIERLKPYTIISSMRERTAFPREVLSQLPNLKLLLTTGARNAAIDVKACEDHGITLAGTTGSRPWKISAPGYDNTSEHCWALILTLAKGTARDDHIVKTVPSGWEVRPSLSLAGKTLGVLGLGRLGSNVARTGLLGFGMKVLTWSSSLTQEKADAQAAAKGLPAGSFEVASSKEDLFRRADVLTVQYVLSERSRGIVGKPELSIMKPSAILVNTSRGPLVNEAALLEAVNSGAIRGVGLDVFETEPLPADSVWRSSAWGPEHGKSEVVISPHMGYVEEQTLRAWYEETAENLERWLKGEEVVNQIKSNNTGYKM